jgi:hypothetical protein
MSDISSVRRQEQRWEKIPGQYLIPTLTKRHVLPALELL